VCAGKRYKTLTSSNESNFFFRAVGKVLTFVFVCVCWRSLVLRGGESRIFYFLPLKGFHSCVCLSLVISGELFKKKYLKGCKSSPISRPTFFFSGHWETWKINWKNENDYQLSVSLTILIELKILLVSDPEISKFSFWCIINIVIEITDSLGRSVFYPATARTHNLIIMRSKHTHTQQEPVTLRENLFSSPPPTGKRKKNKKSLPGMSKSAEILQGTE
jgi:hypothetical protein